MPANAGFTSGTYERRIALSPRATDYRVRFPAATTTDRLGIRRDMLIRPGPCLSRMSQRTDFAIEILEQGWLRGSDAQHDLCSHGRLLLTIGGQSILDADAEYGVSETALALLRTLAQDHTSIDPVAERMVFHGCGAILMMGCPIGVDFSVRHLAGFVTIADVVRHDTTSGAPNAVFPELSVVLSIADYQRAVLDFARKARDPFNSVVKVLDDEFDTR